MLWFPLHRIDKLVALTGEGLDVLGIVIRQSEGFPKERDVLGQVGVADELMGPDGLYYLLPGNDPARVLDQDGEQIQALRCEADGLASTIENARGGVKSVRTELAHARRRSVLQAKDLNAPM
jgi:hypothetical protein